MPLLIAFVLRSHSIPYGHSSSRPIRHKPRLDCFDARSAKVEEGEIDTACTPRRTCIPSQSETTLLQQTSPHGASAENTSMCFDHVGTRSYDALLACDLPLGLQLEPIFSPFLYREQVRASGFALDWRCRHVLKQGVCIQHQIAPQ